MNANPHHFRDLLDRETAHLSLREKEAVSACLAWARELARDFCNINERRDLLTNALALKLIELPNTPEQWLRVLIAKAAMEAPGTSGDFVNASAILAGRAARLLSLAA